MFVQLKKVWLGNRARAVVYLSEPSDAELLIKGGVVEPVYDDPLAPIPAKSMDLRRSTLWWHRPKYRISGGISLEGPIIDACMGRSSNNRLFVQRPASSGIHFIPRADFPRKYTPLATC